MNRGENQAQQLLDASTILRRSADTTFAQVADEAILIHMLSGTYFSLNRLGTEFWEMLDGQSTITSHSQRIAGKYSVAQDRVEADLLELSQLFLDADLVAIA